MSLGAYPRVLPGASSSGSGDVSSVFGRTGAVAAEAGDYDGLYMSTTEVNTMEGSVILTPSAITIAANAGSVDITKSHSTATNNADTTLTPTAEGTNGQQIRVDFVNSDTSAHTVTGAGAASTISYTAPASSTIITYWQSNGSAWTVVGGAPTINDISTVAPVLSDYVSFWDASGGVTGKALLSTVQGTFVAEQLGTHASPDTTAGSITWTAPVYEVWTNTTTTYALPATTNYNGKAVMFYVTGTNALTIDPNGSEVIVRDGTVQTGGVTMTLTGAAGNYVSLLCTGARWVTLGYKGSLAAGS